MRAPLILGSSFCDANTPIYLFMIYVVFLCGKCFHAAAAREPVFYCDTGKIEDFITHHVVMHTTARKYGQSGNHRTNNKNNK